MGYYIWYSEGDPEPARPVLAVPNVTAQPSTASVPITILLYNGPLMCGFNVPIKGLRLTVRVYVYGEMGQRVDDGAAVSRRVTGQRDRIETNLGFTAGAVSPRFDVRTIWRA